LRLLINVPPRHMKSLVINVFFPAHHPGNQADGALRAIDEERLFRPGVKFMHITYRQELTTRDSTKCRRLIESPWYQENWGHRFALLSDQNQKTRFESDKGTVMRNFG
jgi:hypothetical protein